MSVPMAWWRGPGGHRPGQRRHHPEYHNRHYRHAVNPPYFGMFTIQCEYAHSPATKTVI
jgi:hypothetical protein